MRQVLGLLALSIASLLSVSSQAQEKFVLPQNNGFQQSGPILGVRVMRAEGTLEVMSVLPRSAAARLGLEAGDRILEINGHRVNSEAMLHNLLREAAYRHNGNLRVLVDNVRGRFGEPGEQRFVYTNSYLDGYGPSGQSSEGIFYSTGP